jgi:formylglycine-generating enzyme required for sulfatase activity
MNQHHWVNRPDLQGSRDKNIPDCSDAGDQNVVNGKVERGGIVIQGRESRVEIHQHFGDSKTDLETAGPTENISIEYYEPETILIPEGSFWIGSAPGDGVPQNETPKHEVFLPNYRIGKYPVTNSQYEMFIHETGRPVTPVIGWDGQKVPDGFENHPVTGVSWFEALAYCQWISQKTERRYTVPNEAQWEKACRAGKSFLYPWGDDFDPTRSNHGCDKIAPVDAYPSQNEFGCFDLVGNIRQWTCTLWGEKRVSPDPKYAYPWKDDQRNILTASRQIRRVVRGSSVKDEISLLRCSFRCGQLPDDVGLPEARHGFRVAMSIEE